MIKQENPNFLASVYAPNPMEVTYWIDLSENANGNVIKTYDGKKWIPLNNQGGDQDLAELRQAIDNEVNRAKQAEQKLTNDLNNKANKSTTLAGYGITNAYTKLETDNKVNTAVANKVTSTDVTQIKIVDKVPEVGSQTPGILYIKLSA